MKINSTKQHHSNIDFIDEHHYMFSRCKNTVQFNELYLIKGRYNMTKEVFDEITKQIEILSSQYTNEQKEDIRTTFRKKCNEYKEYLNENNDFVICLPHEIKQCENNKFCSQHERSECLSKASKTCFALARAVRSTVTTDGEKV